MPWQAGLLGWYVVVVASALWQRRYSQKSSLPESVPPALAYLLAVTPLGIIVGLASAHHVHWSGWLVFLLIIEGIFIALYNWLSFMAIRRLSVATFQTIFQSYALVTIAMGWLLLKEGLTVTQLAGGAMLLGSAFLAARAPLQQNKQSGKGNHWPAIALTALSAITLGIGLVTEKAALQYMDIGAYFIFGFATQTAALTIIALISSGPRELRRIRPHDVRSSFIMGCLGVSIGFTYIYAIVKSDNISLVTSLCSFGLPLIVLASFFILKEKEDIRLMAGAAALGCAGLIVTAL